MLACEKGDSEVKGASIGDCGPGQWPEEAMLPGLATDESGESGGKRGLRMMSLKFRIPDSEPGRRRRMMSLKLRKKSSCSPAAKTILAKGDVVGHSGLWHLEGDLSNKCIAFEQ